MSEKVGSGDNGSQLLGQEQVLLDWSELPSYGEMTTPAGATVEKTEEKAEEVPQERLTAQMRGDRLLKAVAESLPGSGPEVAVHEDDEEKSDVDTVTMRAEQALGQEQFGALTDYLLNLSYTEEPDEVTKEFRSEAQRVGSIDAGDLWEAVLHQAKMERFGENLADVKFYYSMGFDEFAEVLQGGRLVRKDSEGSALKSDLKFSYDYMEDGEWKSGFADERGKKLRDVTMMFDASLLLEDSFMALGKNPSAGEVDWKKSCLGVVVNRSDYPMVRRMINAYDSEGPLVYFDDLGWSTKAYSADEMRRNRDDYAEKLRRAKELSEIVYAGGADKLIDKHIEEVGARVHEEKLRQFYDKYHEMENDIQWHDMVKEIAEYCKEIFGIFDPVRVRYEDDKQNLYMAMCQWRDGQVQVAVNEAWMGGMSARGVLSTLGHEVCHAYQNARAMVYGNGGSDSNTEKGKYDELCYYNLVNYIDVDVDMVAYKEQFLEREAYRLEGVIMRKYGQMEAKMNRPAERAKRMAQKLGGKITELRSKGVQSVRDGAAQMGKRFVKPKVEEGKENE